MTHLVGLLVATRPVRRYDSRMLYALLKQILQRSAAGRSAAEQELTQEQRVDWAYGTAVIENPAVTKAMVEAAAAKQ